MTLDTWADVLNDSFQNLWVGIVEFLPNLIVAIAIFLLGWIIGAVLGKAVSQLLRSLKVDKALRGAGLEEPVNRAGYSLDIGNLVGGLIKWFVIAVFLIASLDVLQLNQVNTFLREVVLEFLPDVIVAVLILVAGALIAEAMQNIVTASARSARMRSANFLGTVTRWSIWIFAGLAALFQLGVASAFIQTLFTGIVVAISLSFGLAFGLGGREEASRYLEKMRKEMMHKDSE